MDTEQIQIHIQINGEDIDEDYLTDLLWEKIEGRLKAILSETKLDVRIVNSKKEPVYTQLVFPLWSICLILCLFIPLLLRHLLSS